MENSIGGNLNQQMLSMSLVPNPTGNGAPIPAIANQFFLYLQANGIDITKAIKKSLDTAHTIVSDRVAVGQSRLTFFEDIDPNENEHMVVSAIRVLEGTNATLNESVWIPGTENGTIQNGAFDILSNGVRVMKKHTYSDFTRAEEQPYSGWIILPKGIIWESQTEFELQATFPNIIAPVLTNMRMELFGMKLIG
jgi:hypothetical protein